MSLATSPVGLTIFARVTERTWPVLLVLLAGIILAGCEGRSYQRGYDDGHRDGYSKGYEEGYANGYKAGYEKGYGDGFFAARPPGGEITGSSAGWVKFGATLGGLGLLILLFRCAYALVAADVTIDVAATKAGGIAVAVVLAGIMIALGAHRIADPVLLAGRPESPLATLMLVVIAAGLSFFGAACLRSIEKENWARHQQTIFASLSVFGFCMLLAVQTAMMKTPEGERYWFCFIGLGILLGVLAHIVFRLMRKIEG